MKNNFKKILKFVIIHLIELIVLTTVCLGILSFGPEMYKLPAISILVISYVIYLVDSVYDDYLSFKGGDFTV